MKSHNILIYGGGNCEIGGQIGAAFEELEHVEEGKHVRIFGRAHVFNQSCLAMYGRFDEIKECVNLGCNSGQGGIYEYFYNGSQTIKTCEMKTQPITEESFREFLATGKERLEGDEMTLVLIGQGNSTGMLLDFALETPDVLSYESICKAIQEVLWPEVSHIHLIIDVPMWEYLKLPLTIARSKCIESVFIYRRDEVGQVFPIGRFIQEAELFDKDRFIGQGYEVQVRNLTAWKKTNTLWSGYKNGIVEVDDFLASYRQLVRPICATNVSIGDLQMRLRQEGEMAHNEIMDYFKQQYGIIIDKEMLSEWLESLKICTDYHKL